MARIATCICSWPNTTDAEHHLLRQALGLGLDHEHRVLGAGDHQVQLRFGELLGGRD